MDDSQFDRLARSLGMGRSGRSAAGIVGALAALPLLSPVTGEAKKKNKRKKKKKKNKKKKSTTTPAPVTTTARPCTVRPTDDLQAAINAAPAGSTLALCAGTWNVASTLTIKKNLTLVGGGPGQTILDGGNKVRVLFIDKNSIVTVQDLTITRGSTIPTPSAADVFGGGIKTYQADVTLRNVAVTDSASAFGGGIFHQAGTLVLAAGTRVMGNTAIFGSFASGTSGGVGGGICILEGGTLRLETGSSVTSNAATNSGGGIASASGSLNTLLTLEPGSKVSGNTGQGGASDNCYPDIAGICI
jgi:hypothetical protein